MVRSPGQIEDLPADMARLVAGAERFIFDSGSDLLLFDRFKQLTPRAAFLYRVSDDLRDAGVHPGLLRLEEAIVSQFDLVSVPCAYLADRFAGLPRLALQHHGVDKAAFDAVLANPYAGGGGPNAVFVGQHRLDLNLIETASDLFPGWNFHVIGPIRGLPRQDNVYGHGELPFPETIGFVKFADVGLHAIAPSAGAEAFTDSLKVLQYTYCRLPVVARRFLASSRPNLVVYTPGDADSIRSALERAIHIDRTHIDRDTVASWDDLADALGR